MLIILKKHRIVFISLFLVFFISCKKKSSPSDPIKTDIVGFTPKPSKISLKEGSFILSANTQFKIKDNSLQPVADFFRKQWKASNGLEINTEGPFKNNIGLSIDTLIKGKEAYSITVFPDSILVKGSSPQGIFYGLQTISQLLPPNTKHAYGYEIPCVEIEDKPSFKWRGMMLDVSRHFFSVDFIKKQLDLLSQFKINKFHWHLTDDQGWRMEIKSYPELTRIGSVRKNYDGTEDKGYYTQEEIKEVVAYAKERFIDVIPEFDVPGHTMAALTAYPELACLKGNFKVRNLWGVETNILCAGKENTYAFLDSVINEMITLFPYEYYHMGGDESPKDKWKLCADCQSRIKKEHLKNEHELQGYFMARIERTLKKHHKKMIGWDEILEGGITPTTNIMSWQGEEGGIHAANAGHDVIMTPSSHLYLNFYQGDLNAEPLAFGSYVPLEKVYNYHPVPNEIDKSKEHHILGAQANIWTEYVETEDGLEYLLYPRIIALSEALWSSENNKDFNNFTERLLHIYPVLKAKKINFHIPLPEGPETSNLVFTDSIQVSFNTTRPVKITYTLDGSNPDSSSTVYDKSISLKNNTTLKVVTVMPNGDMSKIRTLHIKKRPLIPAVQKQGTLQGIKISEIKGYFNDLSEVDTTMFVNKKIIDSLEGANTTFYWGHHINPENFRAVKLNGYIKVPEDGIYMFSSLQDEVWIADSLIIDNNKSIKKHPGQGMIPLQKGLHKLKVYYLNNVKKGWATDWNKISLFYKRYGDSIYNKVDQTMIYSIDN